MGYQALLFCPDEKMARTVTQVLSELDFSVVPCTEPFAAVKKLMNERFDAVVVDCDNEQNATLLFKSARNTPENQSALAVAVVEGQAGVAKAFRIGANLVLTKPINVEQAKGTLRVARGLLRKNDAAKPAAKAASPAVKPAASAPPEAKPAPVRPAIAADKVSPASTIAPLVTANIAPAKPPAQPSFAASAAHDSTDDDDIFEVSDQDDLPSLATPATQTSWPTIASASPATAEPKRETAVRPASSAGFGTGAASAPAPAREARPKVSIGDKPAATAVPETPVEKTAAADSEFSAEEASAPAPAFTFGGNVDEGKSSGGGSKKALLAVAAVVVTAAIGYGAWMEWGRSSDSANVPASVSAPPVTTPAAVPPATPKSAAAVPSSVPDSTSTARPGATAKTSSDTRSSAENVASHSNKSGSEGDLSKPSASLATKAPAPAPTEEAAQPIVIKSGSTKPAVKSAANVDAPAPSLAGIAPASNAASLPNLMESGAKTPTPVLQTLSVSQGVSQGLLVKKVQPTYPPNALRLRLEGSVLLSATISKNGDISAVKIISGEAQLAHAAVDAVKQWKYKPYLLNGSPVEIQTQVTVNFTLPK
jgi:TonB family protein